MYPLSFFMLLFGVASVAANDMLCLGMPDAEVHPPVVAQATEGA